MSKLAGSYNRRNSDAGKTGGLQGQDSMGRACQVLEEVLEKGGTKARACQTSTTMLLLYVLQLWPMRPQEKHGAIWRDEALYIPLSSCTD